MTRLLRRKRWFPPEAFYRPELCRRCGVCCGSTDGEPCTELVALAEGGYHCRSYARRLGRRRTVTGRPFECVPIKTVIETLGGYPGCGYVREIVAIRKEMGQPVDDLGRLDAPPG
jgi:hypothetical protein